jgi:beta-glucosidase
LSKESTAAPAERSPLSGPPVTTAAPSARSVVEQPALASPEKPPGARIYPKNVADKPVPRIGQQPWMIAEDWLLRHERQVRSPRRAHAKIVFLGDSIVEGWAMAPAFREHFGKYAPLNLGLAGDHTQNVLWRIDNGTLDGVEPDVVVVLVGINNLAGGFTPQQTVAGVRAVIGAVQAQLPSTTVVLLAILPARRSPTSPLRQKVTEANRMLANLAKPGSVSFHDVGSALLEPDETMSTITSRDALHPTPAGYDRLTAAVAPIVEELMRQ